MYDAEAEDETLIRIYEADRNGKLSYPFHGNGIEDRWGSRPLLFRSWVRVWEQMRVPFQMRVFLKNHSFHGVWNGDVLLSLLEKERGCHPSVETREGTSDRLSSGAGRTAGSENLNNFYLYQTIL